MAIDEPYAAIEAVQEQLYGRSGLLAVRTFEITILGDDYASVRWADGVIGRICRNRQLERMRRGHLRLIDCGAS
jgi:hypothetical protein